MLRGMKEAASAMSMQLMAQEAVARNVANISTTGYKQENFAVDGFAAAVDRAEKQISQNGQMVSTARPAIGSLGMEVYAHRFSVDFSQGMLEQTQRKLDLSVEGDGFLMVRTAEGDFYTRGGALLVDNGGLLATEEGYPVLDDQGAEIYLDSDSPVIDETGAISVDGEPVGRLAVVEFAPGTGMAKISDGLYTPDDPAATAYFAEMTQVRQGFLEKSNVDFGMAASQLTYLVRAYQVNQRMLVAQDELAGKAINEVAKV